MSMLDAFFSKGFKGAKCKTLLKLTIPRIKLLRNRREIQLKHMRRDIAKLLENGQEATARIRVEHIIREENMMAAQEIIELFCELISVRLPIIELQRECPLDLKEAISSICFAAPRCADLPELQQVQMLFAAKYGKEFVTAATELMPDCGVNRQIIELLSVRAPSVETKLKLLKEIAEEHELDWDPSASETEFLKPHEDLLNGPNHFTNGSTLPLPEEKHNETVSSSLAEESHEESDLDAGFDSLDLPEVPKVSVRSTSDIPSAPEMVPHVPSSPPHDFELDQVNKYTSSEMSHVPQVEPGENKQEASIASPYTQPDVSVASREGKQFVPFVSSPSFSSDQVSAKQTEPAPSPPVFSSVSVSERQSGRAPLSSFSSAPVSAKKSEPASSISLSNRDGNGDLQDVLAAAQAAAETAERAAAAARAVANLAHVRITDLVTKKNSGSSENEFKGEGSHRQHMTGKSVFDHQDSFDHMNNIFESKWGLSAASLSSHEVPRMEDESPLSQERMPELQPASVPQRSTSLEDDPYFSYPNLFTSQDSNQKINYS
ncbi:IST1 homolog [Phoenix dactylifera]|uniref:IST1 homolog n=1 Tax=Phoenix dactylifera TaxID=42345 RepID=A0A8B7CR42_PHODC|nr:IST1 homolog [Phoenix dactylifera]